MQVAGRLQLLADKTILNNPDWSEYSMGKFENGNHTVRAPVDLQPLVTTDGIHPNPIAMVGLKIPKDDDDEMPEAFEQKGFVWMDKEKWFQVRSTFLCMMNKLVTESLVTQAQY